MDKSCKATVKFSMDVGIGAETPPAFLVTVEAGARRTVTVTFASGYRYAIDEYEGFEGEAAVTKMVQCFTESDLDWYTTELRVDGIDKLPPLAIHREALINYLPSGFDRPSPRLATNEDHDDYMVGFRDDPNRDHFTAYWQVGRYLENQYFSEFSGHEKERLKSLLVRLILDPRPLISRNALGASN